MGVNLTPIMVKRIMRLEDFAGRRLAVDANNFLYQFLALIRTPRGFSLESPDGTVTSHLAGLLYRTTRLIQEYDIKPVFVFDGAPSEYKRTEIEKRRKLREKAAAEWQAALRTGDYAKAFSKAVVTSRLTQPMVQDAKKLLQLLGIPYVEAPSEAEAQAAYMAAKGDVWASSSQDYDSLLFGAPRLVRYLTISGREYLPGKMTTRPLEPELIALSEFLSEVGIASEQLVDLAILVGTDFNEGVKGIGPKTALNLIRKHGSIDNLPDSLRSKVPSHYTQVRELFLAPKVAQEYAIGFGQPREDELYRFLCNEKGFAWGRVEKAVHRLKVPRKRMGQSDLRGWLRF